MLKNMKVKKSLILGFAMVIVISVIIIVASLIMMFNQRNQYEILLNEDVEANEQILYARLNTTMAGRDIRDALLVPDSDANDGLIANAEACLTEAEAALVTLEEAWPSQLTDKTLLTNYQNVAREWIAYAPGLIDQYENYRSSGNERYLQEANDQIYEIFTPLETELGVVADQLDAYLVQGMDAERQKIENSIMITIIAIIVVMVIATCVVVAFALVLIKSITAPTEQVRAALVGFSQGQFDLPADYESKNELGEMCKALRDSQDCLKAVVGEVSYLMTEMARGNFALQFKDESIYVGGLAPMREAIRGINHNLSDTLSQITLSAEQVAAGSEQVSTGAQALAQGATEQASAVEELSATIAEIASGAQKNAKGSEEALDQTNYAASQLDESARNMEEMVQAMDKISKSSEEIGKIIATIENIAFQTNILALNAAVEAARAGSAGKGFAVVADEVRNLSAKSDQAAKATKDLIDNSIASVQEGGSIVNRVSESLKKTVDATEELKKSINGIARAVADEAESINQVTEGIDQISSVVQTNSATSEESAAASEELSSQAAIIKDLMNKFKLRGSDDGYTALPAAAVPSYHAPAASSESSFSSGVVSDFSKY